MKKVTKKQRRAFQANLAAAVVEKDVENAYRAVLDDVLGAEGCTASSPCQCDGFYTNHMFLSLLLEAKHQEDFLNKKIQCETLTQALFYIKRFQESGLDLPNVVLVGDVNECFVVAGSSLHKYLEENLRWDVAPSQAAKEHPEFVLRLVGDVDISPYVFKVDEPDFDFDAVFAAIDQLALNGETERVELDEANVRRIFDSFLRSLFGAGRSDDLTPTRLVSVFVQAMTRDENCYIHPNKPNSLHLNDGSSVTVNGPAFYAFFSRYEAVSEPERVKKLTGIADRLIEEASRRWSGDFWTPSVWAERAISELDSALGGGWRDRYLVWDASCGTCNLTRDWDFPNLYLSTLHQSELDISTRYNRNARARFQFDFLNDDLDVAPSTAESDLEKMPADLFRQLKGRKPVLFLMNPPYATANEAGASGGHKAGVAATGVNERMKAAGAGKCSQQLYAQFFWRALMFKERFGLDDMVIAMFTKPTFMTSDDSFSALRSRLMRGFSYRGGFLFNAAEFSDVSDKWGVSFTVFASVDGGEPGRTAFPLSVERLGRGGIERIGRKELRPCPVGEQASKWIREPVRGKEPLHDGWPYLSSGLAASRSKGKPSGAMCQGAFAYNVNVANDVYKSGRDTFLLSAPAYMGHGTPVCPENFERVVANLAARLLCEKNWVNDKDQVRVPDTSDPAYGSFLADAVVLVTFSNQNHCTSLRGFPYKGDSYDVANQWFFMGADEVKEVANRDGAKDVYFDAVGKTDPFVHSWLSEHGGDCSDAALAVLSLGRKIVRATMRYRQDAHLVNPEHHLNAWDAGWEQVKKLREYDEPDFERFFEAYGKLCDRLRPMVYDLGFLPEPFRE